MQKSEELKKEGDKYYSKNEYETAIDYYIKAVEINPKDAKAWNKLGITYHDLKQYDKSVESKEKAIALNPEKPIYYYNLGVTYKKSKQYDRAIKSYEKVIELNPEYHKAWNQLGITYHMLEQYDKSIECKEEAIALNPEDPIYYFNLGVTYKKCKQYDEAIKSCEKAIELNPLYHRAWNQIGIIYHILKKYDRSIEYKEKAITLNSEEPVYYFNIGLTYEKKNQYDKALEVFEKALDLDKHFEKAINGLNRINTKFPNLHREMIRNKAIKQLKKYNSIYEEIHLNELSTKLNLNSQNLKSLIERMIFENEIQAKIRGDILVFQKIPSVKSHKFTTEDVEVFRGGDWKIKGDKSVFHYKVKIKNNSEFVITNLQVVLGGVPPGLVITSDKLIEFSSLNPKKEVAPTFKFVATDNCVGNELNSALNFVDPNGNHHTTRTEPFELKYKCNLLSPKQINKDEFDRAIENMNEKKIIIESDLLIPELESLIEKKVTECNFALLKQLKSSQKEGILRFEGFAQGLYDKQDVALAVVIDEMEKGSKLVVKAMSEQPEKLTDLLRDLSSRLDDIKSDTELIKEYSSQIEGIFDSLGKLEDIERYLKEHLASDWEKIKDLWEDYKNGKINKKELIKEAIKIIGKKFVKNMLKKFVK